MRSAHICLCARAQTSGLKTVRGQFRIIKDTQQGTKHSCDLRGGEGPRAPHGGAGINGPPN